MEKRLRSIELVFENCEVISIPAEHIKSLYIGKTHRQLFGAQMFGSENSPLPLYMRDGIIADDIRLILNPEGNVKYTTPWNETSRVFDRLTKWNDITGIDLCFSDDTSESFTALWEDSNEQGEENVYQRSLIDSGRKYPSDKGLLILVISKDNMSELMGEK